MGSQNTPQPSPPPQFHWCSICSLFCGSYWLLRSCLIFAYRVAPGTRNAYAFSLKTNLFKECMKKSVALLTKEKRPRMNGKTTVTLFQLYTLYMKITTILFQYVTHNLFKRRYISFVKVGINLYNSAYNSNWRKYVMNCINVYPLIQLFKMPG